MEMIKGKGIPFFLHCADENGNIVCNMCGENQQSFRKLYYHMRGHGSTDWRKMLPEKLANCSEVIVPRPQFIKRTELQCYDLLTEFNLPTWKVTNKRGRSQRGRPAEIKKDDDHEVLGTGSGLRAKKFKVTGEDTMSDEEYFRDTVDALMLLAGWTGDNDKTIDIAEVKDEQMTNIKFRPTEIKKDDDHEVLGLSGSGSLSKFKVTQEDTEIDKLFREVESKMASDLASLSATKVDRKEYEELALMEGLFVKTMPTAVETDMASGSAVKKVPFDFDLNEPPLPMLLSEDDDQGFFGKEEDDGSRSSHDDPAAVLKRL